jgi:hypothetical protein
MVGRLGQKIVNLKYMKKSVIEYSIVGGKFDEHYEDLERAKDSFNALSPKDKKQVQFFSKEWIKEGKQYVEGYVEILSNFSPEKIK